MKRALITGQDGAHLAEILLYEVHGITRRASSSNTERIDRLYQTLMRASRRLMLRYGDLTDTTNVRHESSCTSTIWRMCCCS